MLPGKTCVAGIQHMGRVSLGYYMSPEYDRCHWGLGHVSLGYYMSPRYDMFHRIGTFVAEQRCVLPKYDTCSY